MGPQLALTKVIMLQVRPNPRPLPPDVLQRRGCREALRPLVGGVHAGQGVQDHALIPETHTHTHTPNDTYA